MLRPDITAAFGLTSQNLVRELERRLGGEEAGELSKDQRARTIRVGFEDVDLRELQHARIDGPDGAMLTLGDLADLRVVQGPREILRDGQRRVGRVSAFLTDGVVLSQASTQIRQAVRQMAIPHGYQVTITGEERERAESFGGLQFALLLSVVLVYMVMASLFESSAPSVYRHADGAAGGHWRGDRILEPGRSVRRDGVHRRDHAGRYRRQRRHHSGGPHQPVAARDGRRATGRTPGRARSAASHPDDQRHDHSGAVADGGGRRRRRAPPGPDGGGRYRRSGHVHIDDPCGDSRRLRTDRRAQKEEAA